MVNSEPTPRKSGRPLQFDKTVALDQAMMLFWRHGYEGVSIADLTQAMGISPPSLYAAFGNKDQIFNAALDHYTATRLQHIGQALAQAPSALEAVSAILRGCAQRYTSGNQPPGCLVGSAALAVGPAHAAVRQMITTRRSHGTQLLHARLVAAQATGEISPKADTTNMAHTYTAILIGMSQQASAGAGRATLSGIAEAAIQMWPVLAHPKQVVSG